MLWLDRRLLADFVAEVSEQSPCLYGAGGRGEIVEGIKYLARSFRSGYAIGIRSGAGRLFADSALESIASLHD